MIFRYLLFVIYLLQKGDKNVFQGNWIETRINQKIDIECPYKITFAHGKYRIFNACYGFDPNNPITESGIWSYETSNKLLILQKRVFYVNTPYGNNKADLKIKVKINGADSLVFKIGNLREEIILIRTR